MSIVLPPSAGCMGLAILLWIVVCGLGVTLKWFSSKERR